jgi:hypothetical protein
VLQGNNRFIALTWLIMALIALALCAQQRGLHIRGCNLSGYERGGPCPTTRSSLMRIP